MAVTIPARHDAVPSVVAAEHGQPATVDLLSAWVDPAHSITEARPFRHRGAEQHWQ
ncbi:hypothetical protein [Streptomyces sp. NPDC006355]|uniref:hypothetical protein n=1 Tax=Streptomyces sp. NPDC006355 TaxID=3156758 RepID=UPI0033AFCC09